MDPIDKWQATADVRRSGSVDWAHVRRLSPSGIAAYVLAAGRLETPRRTRIEVLADALDRKAGQYQQGKIADGYMRRVDSLRRVAQELGYNEL